MNERDIELRQQAWDYFEMHGNQRLTTFNFYILISSVVATALFTVLTSSAPRIGWLPGGLLIFFSFVFYKLDSRNAELIKGAEAALKYLSKIPACRTRTRARNRTPPKSLCAKSIEPTRASARNRCSFGGITSASRIAFASSLSASV